MFRLTRVATSATLHRPSAFVTAAQDLITLAIKHREAASRGDKDRLQDIEEVFDTRLESFRPLYSLGAMTQSARLYAEHLHRALLRMQRVDDPIMRELELYLGKSMKFSHGRKLTHQAQDNRSTLGERRRRGKKEEDDDDEDSNGTAFSQRVKSSRHTARPGQNVLQSRNDGGDEEQSVFIEQAYPSSSSSQKGMKFRNREDDERDAVLVVGPDGTLHRRTSSIEEKGTGEQKQKKNKIDLRVGKRAGSYRTLDLDPSLPKRAAIKKAAVESTKAEVDRLGGTQKWIDREHVVTFLPTDEQPPTSELRINDKTPMWKRRQILANRMEDDASGRSFVVFHGMRDNSGRESTVHTVHEDSMNHTGPDRVALLSKKQKPETRVPNRYRGHWILQDRKVAMTKKQRDWDPW